MILFCKLVEIYLLFDYSYFPICFATIFYFCCSPSKQIATAAILMVSAGYNIMPCSRPRLYRVVFLLFCPKNDQVVH